MPKIDEKSSSAHLICFNCELRLRLKKEGESVKKCTGLVCEQSQGELLTPNVSLNEGLRFIKNMNSIF